jgi:hypothetical protein
MARTQADRSAAAKKAAITRRRNRERADAQTAGTKGAASRQQHAAGHAADQARKAAGDVVESAKSAAGHTGDALKEAGKAATTRLDALRRDSAR